MGDRKGRSVRQSDLDNLKLACTPESRAKARETMITSGSLERTSQLIRQKALERYQNPEARLVTANALRNSPKVVGPHGSIRRAGDAARSPEACAKRSKTRKEQCKDPIYVKNWSRGAHLKPNKLELKLTSILEDLFPNQWAYTGDGKMVIGGRIPDFTNVDGKKQVIELFGEYWHKDMFEMANKTYHYQQYGYDCLVVYENELKNEKRLASKLRKFSRR